MALFGKRKEQQEAKPSCCCGGCDCENMEQAEAAKLLKMEAELKTASRSARGTRRNGAKTQRAGAEEKQAGEP